MLMINIFLILRIL